MWKKNNPKSAKTEVRSRDASGLSGVRPSLPGSPGSPGNSYSATAKSGSAPASSPLGAAIGRSVAEPGGPPPVPPSAPPPVWPPANVPAPDSGEPEPLVRFTGRGGPYFALLVKTFFLSLVTLGVYSFWGRTAQRRYLWERSEVLGEPLEYTGTGKELFLGFLIVVPLFLMLTFAVGLLGAIIPFAGAFLFYFALLGCYEFAAYRALRYRLTRTRWRGIRGNLDGSAVSYAARATGYWLAVLLSLGLLLPWATAKRLHLKLNNVRFGDRPLVFQAPAGGLYKVFMLSVVPPAVCLLAAAVGMAVILHDASNVPLPEESYAALGGLTGASLLAGLWLMAGWAWYQAGLLRWICAGSAFGRMRLCSSLTGWRYFRTCAVSVALIFCTFGIAYAWALIRGIRVALNSVGYTGPPDTESLLQDRGDAPATGEGLLDAFDVDLGI